MPTPLYVIGWLSQFVQLSILISVAPFSHTAETFWKQRGCQKNVFCKWLLEESNGVCYSSVSHAKQRHLSRSSLSNLIWFSTYSLRSMFCFIMTNCTTISHFTANFFTHMLSCYVPRAVHFLLHARTIREEAEINQQWKCSQKGNPGQRVHYRFMLMA